VCSIEKDEHHSLVFGDLMCSQALECTDLEEFQRGFTLAGYAWDMFSFANAADVGRKAS
jgi:hypothetical protein